ncbi:SigE family RNA polymerase sigma factor [Stackebrandtia nassauensis]|uniref:RNA polymerase, sigma-24 subunit, ECF subfamily n=1 Tax=Stackebrandtia nassauensis (strain DSM 44728 / CIP 108903 / NRRL B-16338 / NBRC 102104 / LLR-40K-21) TaxID=446470 RepID=D3PYS8_STANL|nr:SigE family RNA polymerase sigma factor [Stackebrandtia nassauensis]ADD43511.1 RNA polymerase, sigma-24 subunit, ECF subfamily [Stackebrandtia nassauensis DSM 44728]
MRAEQEAEFREYVAARAGQLRRCAYLVCGDWHRAEDAVQIAFVKLYGAWNRARRSGLDAYARRIVLNSVIDDHRRAWFRRERSSERLPERPLGDHSQASADRLTIMNALALLPVRQRAVIVLRYWDDQPVEQTALIMRCSTGTVKSQTARGLRTLRGLLTESIHERIEGITS